MEKKAKNRLNRRHPAIEGEKGQRGVGGKEEFT